MTLLAAAAGGFLRGRAIAGTPVVETCSEITLSSRDRREELLIRHAIREVLLVNPPAELMGIEITLAGTDRTGRARVRIADVSRHL
jgi:hypothetical protein